MAPYFKQSRFLLTGPGLFSSAGLVSGIIGAIVIGAIVIGVIGVTGCEIFSTPIPPEVKSKAVEGFKEVTERASEGDWVGATVIAIGTLVALGVTWAKTYFRNKASDVRKASMEKAIEEIKTP